MSTVVSDLIQFKAGPELTARLHERAELWGLGLNETGRRLLVLSEYGLAIDTYEEVSALASALGKGHSFAKAARYFAFERGRNDV